MIDFARVSVVIPTKDRLSLLQRAVDSVNKQNWKNIEIIIIDNFSGSPLIQGMINSIIPLKILRNDEMLPLPVNRNLGAEKATGEFVAFLDDDDYYYPVKIDEAINAFRSDPGLQYVYGDTLQLDAAGKQITRAGGVNDLESYLRWRHIHVNALVMRRSSFLEIKFSSDMTTFEDVEFIGRMLKQCKGTYLPNIHAVWNRDNRPDQLTKKNWKRIYSNWKRLCGRFQNEIETSVVLKRYYHRKMLLLSIMHFDIIQAVRSFRYIF